MQKVLEPFIEAIRTGRVEIYNEFSLQHEIGIFLRNHYPDRKIQFERNVSHFGFSKSNFIKREIDVSIFDQGNTLHHAIELKYPKNGQYPEQMFSFCKDIVFLEQLKKAGFRAASLLILAGEPPFYSGTSEGIYAYFRSPTPITGSIRKPIGAKDQELHIEGKYVANWHEIKGSLKYTLIDV